MNHLEEDSSHLSLSRRGTKLKYYRNSTHIQ
jgi:hypothetical protein